MAFKTSVKTDKAFKNLLGYAYSEEEKYYWEEGIYWALSVAASDVWIESDKITYNDPDSAVANGVAQKLDHYVTTPNSSAFYNGKDRAWTIRATPGDESSALLTGFIPHVRYGDNYRFQLYDYDDNLITVPQMIEHGIIFDYSNGVIVINNDSNYTFNTPFKITVWRYIGKTTLDINGGSDSKHVYITKAVNDLPELHVHSINAFRKYLVLPPERTILVRCGGGEPQIVGDFITVYGDSTQLIYGVDWWFYHYYSDFTMHKFHNSNVYTFHVGLNYNGDFYVNADIIVFSPTVISSYNSITIDLVIQKTNRTPYFSVGIENDILTKLQGRLYSLGYKDGTCFGAGVYSIKSIGNLFTTEPPKYVSVLTEGVWGFDSMSAIKDSSDNDIFCTIEAIYRQSESSALALQFIYPSYVYIESLGAQWYIEEIKYGNRKKFSTPQVHLRGTSRTLDFKGNVGFLKGPAQVCTARRSYPIFYRCRNMETGEISETIGPFGWNIKKLTSLYSSDPASNKYYYGIPYFMR